MNIMSYEIIELQVNVNGKRKKEILGGKTAEIEESNRYYRRRVIGYYREWPRKVVAQE